MKQTLKILTLAAFASAIVGCGNNSNTSSTNTETKSEVVSEEEGFQINFVKKLPIVEPYKEFDAMSIIVPVEGATYSFEGLFFDSRGKDKIIEFNDSIMVVPNDDECVAELTVTATKDGQTITKDIGLTVRGTPDVMDDGLLNCWAEDPIGRTFNYNPEYVKSGDTSVKVTFSGYYNHMGTQFCNVTGHLSNNDAIGIYDKEYLSIYKEADVDKAYEDAIVCMWVYNSMKAQEEGYDDSLYFGVRIKESEYGPNNNGVDIDWGTCDIKEAKRGEWTLIYFELKDYGKTSDFYKDVFKFYSPSTEDYYSSFDALNFKVLGKNVSQTSGSYDTEVKYNYSFYFDGYDIMSRAQFNETYGEYLASLEGNND